MAPALPPTFRSGFPGGTLLGFRKDPIALFMAMADQCGDIARFKLGFQDAYLVTRPRDVQDVLVTHHLSFMKGLALQRAKKLLGEGLLTSEGAFHTRQRRLAQPAFHRQRIAAYGTVMTDYADRTRSRWQAGDTVDIHQEMTRLTLAIVGKTLFDADVEAEAEDIGTALTDAMAMFDLLTVPFADLIEKLPLPRMRRFKKARERLDATIFRIIEERRAGQDDRGDLLSMLLLAQDTDGDGGGMTDQQLRDEALTIFLAGHETTANALTWTWYLLAQHPEVVAKLHREIDTVLGGRLPTVEDLPGLRYTEMIFAESMRLYPPAWAMGRRALKDVEIGGYVLPAQSLVVLSPYVSHHDPRNFPEPNRFDPMRWTPEEKAKRPKFAYFPFGGGPRVCIGEPFAWMEGVLLIATIAQHWDLALVPTHPVELQPLVTLRPKHGIKMTLRRRQTERWPMVESDAPSA